MRDDDDGDVTGRRRWNHDRSNRTTLAVAGGAALVLLLVGCCGFGTVLTMVVSRRTNEVPKAGAPATTRAPANGDHVADNWTYNEMFAHVKAHGDFTKTGQANGKTFYFDNGYNAESVDKWLFLMSSIRESYLQPGRKGIIEVRKCANSEAARQSAGSVPTGYWNWGRWLFNGNEDELRKLKSALE